jgi:hypothetical protein
LRPSIRVSLQRLVGLLSPVTWACQLGGSAVALCLTLAGWELVEFSSQLVGTAAAAESHQPA